MASSKVKNMISLYENFSYTNVNSESTKLSQKHRTKSVGNITTSQRQSQDYKSETAIHLELLQIEQQVSHLTNTLNKYKTYSRENHIYYQNQIFFLLTDIIKVETRGDPQIVNKKSELIEILKRLNVGLNSRLPSAAKKIQVEIPVHTPVVKKEGEEIKPKEEKKVIRRQSREELDGGDGPSPSVKSLKQLWEKNINESEKEKPKENKSNKMSELYMKLNGSVNDYKYVPFGERFKKQNSAELNNYSGSLIPPQTPIDFYEQSVLLKTDDGPQSLTPDTHSSQSEDGSDQDSDFQEHQNL